MQSRLSALVLAGLFLLAFGSLHGVGAQTAGDAVLVADVDGAITPVMADYVDDAIDRAERDDYEAVVIELDTPGGLDTSMRDIVQDILDARVPVVVYVAPAGARAASAGAIITLSAHVAAMSPGTAIGAATPVSGGGDDLEDKVVNDAAAYAESLARLRDRNVEFATDAVRDGRSISADEAVEIGAVDLLAGSLDELLTAIDGRTVLVAPNDAEVTLRTAGAAVDEFDMGLLRTIRQVLADPNLAFLLISIGTLGLIYELATPGIGAGAAVAVACFVLALAGVSVLPINAVGVAFIVLAAAFFVAEVLAPGIGVAAVSGAIMLVLGGVFLVDDTPGIEVSLAAVVPVALVTGLLAIGAGRLAMRSRRVPSTTTGPGLFVGREVTVRLRDGRPLAFVEGGWWAVRPADVPLQDGEVVTVAGMEGLELLVEPVVDATKREEQS